MQITSIDNCYEEDGLMNLVGLLGGMNLEPNSSTKQFIVAILPEYNDDGRLNRLNVCTNGPYPENQPADEKTLMDVVERIITELQAQRADAYAKLDAEAPIQVVKGTSGATPGAAPKEPL